MTESQLLGFAMRRLWAEKSWLTIDRINCGTVMVRDKGKPPRPFRGARKGTSDLVGYFAPLGRYLGLEFKVGKNKQSPEQVEFEHDVKAKGGEYFLVRTPEELEEVVRQLKPGAV